jgi:hypothetical protein
MNRVAPEFIFAQLSKPMDRTLGKSNERAISCLGKTPMPRRHDRRPLDDDGV